MIRPIVVYGDPVLRVDCPLVKDVTPAIKALAQDMIETMIEADGVGLAAPQIGEALQLAVVDVSHAPELTPNFSVDGEKAELKDWMPLVFINPQLRFGKKKETETEGCLSFPELRYKVQRPELVTAELTLLDGRKITVQADGLLSRAIQHETDHLHGRLFIDRISAVDKLSLKRKIQDMYEKLDEEFRQLEAEEKQAAKAARAKKPDSAS
jgi:peptide deformylase